MGWAREGGIGALGESGHPQRRVQGKTQHRQHHELGVGDIRVALHLSVESRWQQLNHSDESTPCPGIKLVHTRHLAIHASSLTNFACCDNYPLLYLTLQVIFWIGGLTPVTGGSRRFHSQNGTVKLIGALEVLGAVGLIAPLVTHIRRKEPPLFPAILGVLAVASALLGFIVLTH